MLRLAAAALISAIISFFLARSLATPLGHLRQASQKIAAGELSARVGQQVGRRRDEIGQLATDFDEMASRLQTMQAANQRLLRDVSHELRSPLARLTVALEIARKKGAGHVGSELDRIELEGQRLETLVNDVLALKDADLGISMGSGSEATKAVADLVLTDNAFSSLPVSSSAFTMPSRSDTLSATCRSRPPCSGNVAPRSTSGSSSRFFAGTTAYSANPPWVCSPMRRRGGVGREGPRGCPSYES